MAGVDMYCGHGCGSQIVNGNFVAGLAANTTVNACPNNNGNGHNMIPTPIAQQAQVTQTTQQGGGGGGQGAIGATSSFANAVKLSNQAWSVVILKIFTMIMCLVSFVFGIIELSQTHDESSWWSILLAAIIVIVSFTFWFFAVLVPNCAFDGSKWATSYCMEQASEGVIIYSTKLWINCIGWKDGKCICCPMDYDRSDKVYGCGCCLAGTVHPAQWLYFEICLRRWIITILMVANFWNRSIFYGFGATLIVTVAMFIEWWITMKEMCMAKDADDSMDGPPVRFNWFGASGQTIRIYKDFNGSLQNVFAHGRLKATETTAPDIEAALAAAVTVNATNGETSQAPQNN